MNFEAGDKLAELLMIDFEEPDLTERIDELFSTLN